VGTADKFVTERTFTEVDIENWPRRATYEFFKDYKDPFFNFSANVDVTQLYSFSKKNSLSFALSVLYCSQCAVNEIEEFKIRSVKGRLIKFDTIHATQTILNDDETFSFAYFEMKNDIVNFDRSGKAALETYRKLKTFDVERGRCDLIYYSVIPWVSFTSFKHASRLDRTQTVPRIVFGKMFERNGRRSIPVSVEANHTIMDGLHMGKYFIRLQQIVESL
jgi:chloramphenicol O-acetyltransferase type A